MFAVAFNLNAGVSLMWLSLAVVIVVIVQIVTAAWARSGAVTGVTAARLEEAAKILHVALNDKETIAHLERLSARFSLLEKSSTFSAAFLTAIGVALGLLGSVFAEWMLHGSGFFWQVWQSGDPVGAFARASQIGGIGIALSFVTGFVVLPFVDGRIRNTFRLKRLPDEVATMNHLLDQALKIVREKAPATTP
jgi:hypothetical protein